MPRRTLNLKPRLSRSQGGMDARMRAQLDRFVEALCMGLGSTQAAVYAGVSSRSAARQGGKWRLDAYVTARFAALREKLSRDQLCSFAELALNVKVIAFTECEAPRDRIAASALLAKLMGHEAAAKSAVSLTSGVMLIPTAVSQDQWEAMAIAAQAALQKEVEHDANR